MWLAAVSVSACEPLSTPDEAVMPAPDKCTLGQVAAGMPETTPLVIPANAGIQRHHAVAVKELDPRLRGADGDDGVGGVGGVGGDAHEAAFMPCGSWCGAQSGDPVRTAGAR